MQQRSILCQTRAIRAHIQPMKPLQPIRFKDKLPQRGDSIIYKSGGHWIFDGVVKALFCTKSKTKREELQGGGTRISYHNKESHRPLNKNSYAVVWFESDSVGRGVRGHYFKLP